ncbi:hypothetical protein [Streptomyces sp. NBC_00370]|uniref:hypothetical protein n=1 Tax=Streptomyces sp. NBC_00370 TaxID=2975728 RepID=UPI002E257DE6
MSDSPGAPPPHVLAAFGAASGTPPRLLPGGQGQTWRSGGLVLKPVALEAETHWRAETPAALAPRTARWTRQNGRGTRRRLRPCSQARGSQM